MENVLYRQAETPWLIESGLPDVSCKLSLFLVPEALSRFGTSNARKVKPIDDSGKSSFPSLPIVISSENLLVKYLVSPNTNLVLSFHLCQNNLK